MAPESHASLWTRVLGRIGGSLRLLLGLEPTWWSIRAEWTEVRSEAAQMFDNLNALQARLAKRLKELSELREEPDPGAPEPVGPADRKAALRRRAAEARGLRVPVATDRQDQLHGPNGARWVPAHTPEPDHEAEEDE